MHCSPVFCILPWYAVVVWCNCAVLMAVVGQVTLTACQHQLLLCNAYGYGGTGHIDSIKDTTQHSMSVWYKT